MSMKFDPEALADKLRELADLRSQLAAANERADAAERERDWMLAHALPSQLRESMWLAAIVLFGETPLAALRREMAAEAQTKASDKP